MARRVLDCALRFAGAPQPAQSGAMTLDELLAKAREEILTAREVARSNRVGNEPRAAGYGAQLGKITLQLRRNELVDALAAFEIFQLVLPEIGERRTGWRILAHQIRDRKSTRLNSS